MEAEISTAEWADGSRKVFTFSTYSLTHSHSVLFLRHFSGCDVPFICWHAVEKPYTYTHTCTHPCEWHCICLFVQGIEHLDSSFNKLTSLDGLKVCSCLSCYPYFICVTSFSSRYSHLLFEHIWLVSAVTAVCKVLGSVHCSAYVNLAQLLGTLKRVSDCGLINSE